MRLSRGTIRSFCFEDSSKLLKMIANCTFHTTNSKTWGKKQIGSKTAFSLFLTGSFVCSLVHLIKGALLVLLLVILCLDNLYVFISLHCTSVQARGTRGHGSIFGWSRRIVTSDQAAGGPGNALISEDLCVPSVPAILKFHNSPNEIPNSFKKKIN